MVEVYQGERIDDTGFGNIRLIQKPEEFCYGVDAVILADFAAKNSTGKPESIMDLGTGTGIIPLILSHKTKASRIMGLELQGPSYDRAVRNASLNGLEDRLSFINDDVKSFSKTWGMDLKGSFDVVTSNPPYTAGSGGLIPDNRAKYIARHETSGNLEDFIKTASMLLKDRGDFFMVHRPSRLVDIFSLARKYKVEPKEIKMILPKEGEKPNIVLVHMVKHGGPELNILKPLAVHTDDGGFTDELKEAYL